MCECIVPEEVPMAQGMMGMAKRGTIPLATQFLLARIGRGAMLKAMSVIKGGFRFIIPKINLRNNSRFILIYD